MVRGVPASNQLVVPVTLLLTASLLLWAALVREGAGSLGRSGALTSTLQRWWREAQPSRVFFSTASGVLLAGRCPARYHRPRLAEIEAFTSRPLFLNGDGDPLCIGRLCKARAQSNGRDIRSTGGNITEEESLRFESFCTASKSGPTVCTDHGDTLVSLLLKKQQHGALIATPCDLWPYLRTRALWLFGDSQTMDFFKALVCALRDFRDPSAAEDLRQMVAAESGPLLPQPRLPPLVSADLTLVSSNLTQVRYFSKHKISPAEPACVQMVDATRVCYIRYDKMEQMESQLEELSRLVAPEDISSVNFGLHHNAEQLAERLPRLLSRLQASSSIGRNLYYKDTVPVHFDTRTGGYPMGTKPPFVCRALHGLDLLPDGTLELEAGDGPNSAKELYEKGNKRNLVTLPLIAELNIPVIHSYNLTAVLHDYHRDNGAGHECSHYCWPVPGLWVYSLLKTLQTFPPVSAVTLPGPL